MMNKLLAALRAQYVTPYLNARRSQQSSGERPYRRKKWRKYYSVPKLVAGELPRSLHQEFRRCGKAGCKCSSGRAEDLHGPYWVRRWREEGKVRKKVESWVEEGCVGIRDSPVSWYPTYWDEG